MEHTISTETTIEFPKIACTECSELMGTPTTCISAFAENAKKMYSRSQT